MTLVFFDLDHTLLAGDSDVLWCEFLMREGVLDRAVFEPQNQGMETGYANGSVSAEAFCGFYVGTLAGHSAAQWAPLRQRYVAEYVLPRIPAAARQAVAQHQAKGDRVVLSTATNRFLTELTAQHLGIAELIATECEVDGEGRFTGRIAGTLNMKQGKLLNAQAWLAAQGMAWEEHPLTFYSDSINDLPLLSAAKHPVAVDPDAKLRQHALAQGWPIVSLVGPRA